MKLSGWGRYPQLETKLHAPRDRAALTDLVRDTPDLIARGNGRAYGDSALNPAATVSMRHFNHLRGFDPATGVLEAEAGVMLGDIIRDFLPRGWFPAVTPGTKFVTLGGMIAADVHGKNHHRDGSFRTCVESVEVMDGAGRIHRASAGENPELFAHTIGGMGLTGLVLSARIRLRPVETGWIRQRIIPAPDLDAALAAFEAAGDAPYSVAWIDCLGQGARLGRSLLILGDHARRAALPPAMAAAPFKTPQKRRRSLPFDLPGWALNRASVGAFNRLYYWVNAQKTAPHLVDWDSYFYPLDAILGWNRIYGRKGFMQFQCALPLDRSRAGLTDLLGAISQAGAGSFLAVLKRLGPAAGPFSFPLEGYTLALDFPVSARTLALMARLDQITIAHGGRFYLAKDARLDADDLRAADPRADGFARLRADRGWSGRFRSAQSERLLL